MRRILFIVALAAIMLAALVTTPIAVKSAQVKAQPPIAATQATSPDASAPRIIDLYPPTGAQVAPREPAIISFDQPMDQANVESAITFTPQITGTFAWQDAQTVTFTPAASWPQNVKITLTIGTTARTRLGVPLDSAATYTFSAMPPLQVSSITPKDTATVTNGQSRIVVAFDRPVISLTTAADTQAQPSPIQISPAIAGSGEWINTSVYAFTPKDALPGGAKVTITVPAGLTAVDGSVLEKAITSSFTIGLAQVKQISTQTDALECSQQPPDAPATSAANVGLNCPVRVTFTEPMDQAVTEAAFALTLNGAHIPGQFAWSADRQTVTFTPSARLQTGSTYIVSIGSGARTEAHGQLAPMMPYPFTTLPLPAIADGDVTDGETDVTPGSGLLFRFSTIMKLSSVRTHFTITPLPADLMIRGSQDYDYVPTDQTVALSLDFVSQPNTRYTLTLSAGAEDIYGNRIGADQRITFTTGSPPVADPIAYPVMNGTIITSRNTNGAAQIDMLVRGKLTVPFAIYAIPDKLFQKTLTNFQFAGYCHGSEDRSGSYNGRVLIDTSSLTPLRQWTQAFDQPADRLTRQSVALNVPGGSLPPGTYLVQIGKYQTALVSATANVTIKRTQNELFAWVTDLATAQPLPNVPITLVFNKSSYFPASDNAPLSIHAGTTDTNGILRVDLTRLPTIPARTDFGNDAQIYVVAQSGSAYGAWYSCLDSYRSTLPTRHDFLYTDRPIYRPGETVYVKGIVRAQNDMTFTPLSKKSAHLALYGNSGGASQVAVATQDVPITSAGSFSASFALPDSINTGTASINLSFPDDNDYTAQTADGAGYYGGFTSNVVTFQIAAFRPPDFAAVVTASQSSIVQDDPLTFGVAASYYSGGTVSNAPFQWKLYTEPISFQYSGAGSYTFNDERWQDFYSAEQTSGTAMTDASGKQQVLTSDTQLTNSLLPIWDGYGGHNYGTAHTADPAPGKRPVAYIPEVTLSDQAGNPVSARAPAIMAHPADVYVGISAQQWDAQSNKPFPISLIAVRPDSAPIVGQAITTTISRMTWKLSQARDDLSTSGQPDVNDVQWFEDIQPISTIPLITSADGTALTTFFPSEPGTYRIAVQSADAQGRVASATLRVYISGSSAGAADGDLNLWGDPLTAMQPQADKSTYNPGQNAVIRMPLGTSGPATVLVTVERSGVLTSDVIHANGPILTYTLPITDAYAPSVYVAFTDYRGIDAEHAEPGYTYGSVKLTVQPIAKRLTVTLTPTTTEARPGGSATFNVSVTDMQGKPVSAEVSLALVDKSVLALVDPNTPTLENAYYDPLNVTNYVTTDLSMFGYQPLIKDSFLEPCCFGGGAGGSEPLGGLPGYIRDKYKFTALWSPFVTTDVNGKASITVTLPDNATTWQLDGRAVTADTRVGEGSTDLLATLPLLIRPVVPRFLVAGDQVQLAGVINNNSGRDQAAQVSLKAQGVTLHDPAVQSVFIPAGGRVRVAWNATVDSDAINADLVFAVSGQDGLTDAARPLLATGPNGTIPIYRYSAYDNTATSGALLDAGRRTEQITLPPQLAGSTGTVTLRLDSSLASAQIDSLKSLVSSPYDSIDTISGRILANVYTLRTVRTLKLNQPSLEQKLTDQITGDSRKLYAAQTDHGWAWFPGGPPDPLVTANATLALSEAELLGFTGYLRESSIAALETAIALPSIDAPDWMYNQQTYYLYVRSRVMGTAVGKGDKALPDRQQGAVQALFGQRVHLNLAGRAYLLLAANNDPSASVLVTALADDLESAAIRTPTDAHWEEQSPDDYTAITNTGTTALALSALIAARPHSPLLPNTVRWLMTERQGENWSSLDDTVWSLHALTDWMQLTGELNSAFAFNVQINHSTLISSTAAPLSPVALTLSGTVAQYLVDRVNTLTISRSAGSGALYYTLNLTLYTPADRVKAVSRGVTVTRQYFAENAPQTPITSAWLGDVVTVRLTFTVNQDTRYFVLEDPYPAGLEPIESFYNTASLADTSPDLSRLPDSGTDYRSYWGWWYVDHVDLRDQQATLYASSLSRGTYVFTYQIRATVPGTFQVIPARGYPSKQPGIFGRTDGATFTVIDDAVETF